MILLSGELFLAAQVVQYKSYKFYFGGKRSCNLVFLLQ